MLKNNSGCYGWPVCGATENLCKDLVSDFKAAERLTVAYPDRFKVIRYEELASNPYDVTRDVLAFYGLPFHDEVKRFLRDHTERSTGGALSTYRDSKANAFSWRRNTNFTYMNDIQSHCTEAMNLWGYRKFNNEEEFKDESISSILPSPFD